MFEIINLKTAIVFRVVINDKSHAFSTKTFRGKNVGRGNIPDPKDHVPYEVHELLIGSSDPWYRLEKPLQINVLWSQVQSVQLEKA